MSRKTQDTDPASNGARRPISRTRKACYAALTVGLVLLSIEIAFRLTVAEPDSAALFVEHQQIITVAGLPLLNEVLESDQHLFWRLTADVNDFRIHGTIGERQIDFRLSTAGHRRSPVVTPKEPSLRLLALGDSCTFGLGVDDSETWPAQLQTQLHERGNDIDVINAGVPGYTAFQGLEFLRREGLDLDPDIIVVCFGFNDRQSWASRSDRETQALLNTAAGLDDSWLQHSSAYRAIKRKFREPPTDRRPKSRRRPRLNQREFAETLSEITALARTKQIPVLYLIWPFEPQVLERYRGFEPYQQIVSMTATREKSLVINLIDPFIDSRNDRLFLDHIHASPAGCALVAEQVARIVVEHIQ